MSTITQTRPAFSPLDLASRSPATRLAAVLFGTLVLAVSSQITVPMVPVPITLQTLVVPMIGALYGWRLGLATVLAWLGEAMIGLPVLQGGTGGLLPFVGPTAGYLAALQHRQPRGAGFRVLPRRQPAVPGHRRTLAVEHDRHRESRRLRRGALPRWRPDQVGAGCGAAQGRRTLNP